jgi:hypothetical protein
MKTLTILMSLLLLAVLASGMPALATESGTFSGEELDQMHARIALYPDSR